MKIFNKNEWKKVKLGDVCDLRNGVAIKSEDYIINSNTLNCRMSNIRPDGTFDILYNAKYLPDNFSEKYKNYLLKNGDLVIAMTDMAGDPKILGVPTVVKSNGFNIIQNQRVGKLELLTDNIDENYLKFALQSKNVKNYFKKFSAGGVQLNLSKKEILNAPIVLPTIEEQKILVNLFKTIESFIYLRKKELLNLNSLNKSLFIRFFGNPEYNEKGWSFSSLKDISLTKGEYGSNKPAINYNGGYRYIRITDITTNGELKEDKVGVSDEEIEAQKYLLKENDILFARSGATVGKNFFYNKKYGKCIFAGYLIRFQLNVHLVLATYLKKFLETNYYWNWVKNCQNIVAQPNINAKQYGEDLKIMLPPIELQNKFAERVEKIEKLSFEIEEAIKEAENLYNSLISKYFD